MAFQMARKHPSGKGLPSGLPAGKLPVKLLQRLLKRYATASDPSVITGPSIGIDSAVIKPPPGLLIAKTDPITFVTGDIGVYAIHVNANDIAVMGGAPRWFLAAILLPVGITEKAVEGIFSGLSRACKGSGITLCGGHTEVTPGVDRPIVVGQMLGTISGKPVTGAGAREGDALILTKGIAIEATSVIARTLENKLKGAFPDSFIRRCRDYIKKPGLSVVEEARTALASGRVHAMHDPTEGGLSSGLHELAIASGCGILVDRSLIPVLPESKTLSEFFGIDPLGAISSGALLISAHPADSQKIINAIKSKGIVAVKIGTVTARKTGVRIVEGKKTRILKHFERDELTKILV